mmetsp:Transcript_12216/g.20858  ORF Transcript_12216/g.20858 Transcript_12216/m.20858 type:complete len:218 (+) Transcript_12216:43-696(+)
MSASLALSARWSFWEMQSPCSKAPRTGKHSLRMPRSVGCFCGLVGWIKRSRKARFLRLSEKRKRVRSRRLPIIRTPENRKRSLWLNGMIRRMQAPRMQIPRISKARTSRTKEAKDVTRARQGEMLNRRRTSGLTEIEEMMMGLQRRRAGISGMMAATRATSESKITLHSTPKRRPTLRLVSPILRCRNPLSTTLRFIILSPCLLTSTRLWLQPPWDT